MIKNGVTYCDTCTPAGGQPQVLATWVYMGQTQRTEAHFCDRHAAAARAVDDRPLSWFRIGPKQSEVA